MKTLKKSTCYKCPFYARYEAENDRQKVIAICEKSMRIFPKIDVFGLEVIVDDEIPDWCELEDDSVTLPYSPVPPKKENIKFNCTAVVFVFSNPIYTFGIRTDNKY